MKVFARNAVIKKILIVFITIIMISNFVMPNYVQASVGKKLVSGFFYLIAYVGDAGISIMQKMMTGTGDIKEGDEYSIKYSPGVIFSNEVPMLDINFISPSSKKIDSSQIESEIVLNDQFIAGLSNQTLNFQPLTIHSSTDELDNYGYNSATDKISYSYTTIQQAISQGSNIINLIDHSDEPKVALEFWTYDGYLYKLENLTKKTSDNLYVYRIAISAIEGKQVGFFGGSVTETLQPHIANWYQALRTIALVGLLSVLVYVGIRIILSSSSASDKAKYKNMLKDWVVAICILFVLHYIMAFMLGMTTQFNDIINIDSNGTDSLMTTIRQAIGDNLNDAHVGNTAGYTVMYLALVILTLTFTVQYLKRVIYMAFLTMVAPMIALTYPLDKIKDGKAQAFSFWLKEYIFNCLIQPVHLLIYTVFVTNAIDIATENMLYAIVVLTFMVPAEKFIKEMFGMKSSSPTGTLGAAAGGAFVMSMINKMKAKPPKDDAGSGGSSGSGVRTASSGAGAAGAAGGTGSAASPSSAGGPTGSSASPSSAGGSTGSSASPSGAGGPSGSSGSTSSSSGTATSPRITGSSTAGRRIGGWNKIGSGAGKFFRATGGAALGLAAGTVGLAAQVADGDLFDNPDKALTQTLGAAAVGYATGSNLAGRAGNVKNWIDKKTLGTEEYNNRNFDRKFYQSDGYKMIAQDPTIQALCKNNGIKVAEATQTFLNEGITDASKIRDALQNGISGEVYKGYDKAGVSSGKDIATLQANDIGANDMKAFASAGETSVSKITGVKAKYKDTYDNAHLATMFTLAKHAPRNKDDFKAMMVGRTFNGRELEDTDAEKIFSELVDFF